MKHKTLLDNDIIKLITDIKSEKKSCKISKTNNLDSFACTGVASMAPGTAHYFCLKAFAALLQFLGPLQLHFINSCPPDADCAVTADRRDTDVSRLPSSSLSSFWGHKSI